MHDERIDFTPLDPRGQPERFERNVGAITAAASAELAMRRARSSVFWQLAHWRRPLLAAAAIATLISVGTLAMYQRPASLAEEQQGVAEALGVPETIATWVRSGETPSTAELLVALEGSR